MASPQIRTIEYDYSQRVSAYPGLYGLLIGNFNKGPVGERVYIVDHRQADIVVGIPDPGSDQAYYIMDTYLLKSKRLWAMRVANGALYGGIHAGACFNTSLGVSDGVTLIFDGVLPYERCHPLSVTIWVDQTKIGYDDGDGKLKGSILDESASTVNYETGEVHVVVGSSQYAIPKGATVYARWGFYPKAFSAGMGDVTTYEFDGRSIEQDIKHNGSIYQDVLVPFPLVAPEDAVTVAAGATIKFFDGDTLIAYIDEYGKIIDTASYLDASAPKKFSYSSGNLRFTLNASYTPLNTIRAEYRSRFSELFTVYGDNPGDWVKNYSTCIKDVDVVNNNFKIVTIEKRGNYAPIIVGDYTVAREFKKDGLDRQMYLEDRINGKSYYVRVLNNHYVAQDDINLPIDWKCINPTPSVPHNSIDHNNWDYLTMDGGFRGFAPTVNQYINALYTFNNKEDVKVQIVMDTVGHYLYQLEVAKFCDRDMGGRGDCYGVIFVPYDVEQSNNYVNNAINYRKYVLNFSTSFVGLYMGHVLINDRANGREIYIPPSGFVGSAFSYTADQYEPWFPAAGWRRGKIPVIDLFRKLKLEERDILYDNDINCFKYKPGRGVAIWGQKTMYGVESSLSRANVRWVLIIAENAIEEYLEEYEFEINDPFTRATCKTTVDSFLASVKLRRGLYAFDVVCNDDNNPAELIDAHQMNIDYYVQPTQAAETIEAKAIVTKTGVNFESVRITYNSLAA